MSVYSLLVESRLNDIKRRYLHLTDADINDIFLMDPTPTKKYVLWLASQYTKQFSIVDVKKLLAEWDKHIDRLTPKMISYLEENESAFKVSNVTENNYKDINTYDYYQVAIIVEYLISIPTKTELAKIIKNEINVIYRGPMDGYNVLIIEPLTYRASCHYGYNTKWCTASRKTNQNFKNYTSRGKLYYMIFNNQESNFKYAIFFDEYKDEIEIYDETDKRVANDIFFNMFPGIRTIFKTKLPKNTYEYLQDILNKKYSTDDELKTIVKKLDKSLGDDYIMIEDKILSTFKSGNIKLYISDDFIVKTFFLEDDYRIAARVASGYSEPAYEFDSYSAKEDWDNGYVLRLFNNEDLKVLTRYFQYTSPKGVLLTEKLLKTNNHQKQDEIIGKIIELLNSPSHTNLRDNIVDEYQYAMDIAINESGDEEVLEATKTVVKDFFDTICQDPFILVNLSNVTVSIADVIRWYDRVDNATTFNTKDTSISKQLKKLNELHELIIYDTYEFYSGAGYDSPTFNANFTPTKYIENQIDEIETNPEILEQMEMLDMEITKLMGGKIFIGSTYHTPDDKYTITPKIGRMEDQKILTRITNNNTIRSKNYWLTAEQIINLLTTPTLFDIM